MCVRSRVCVCVCVCARARVKSFTYLSSRQKQYFSNQNADTAFIFPKVLLQRCQLRPGKTNGFPPHKSEMMRPLRPRSSLGEASPARRQRKRSVADFPKGALSRSPQRAPEVRAQELCEKGCGPVLSLPTHPSPVPNKPHGFCGRRAP